jgi:hypothetical protein
VKPAEARELIWLVPAKVFADRLALRLTERAARAFARTALLELLAELN